MPRRQFESVAVAREVAGLLESTREVVEGIEIAGGIVAHEIANLVAIDRRQVSGRLDVHQGILESLHRLESADRAKAPSSESDPRR